MIEDHPSTQTSQEPRYGRLVAVIEDDLFPEVDMLLRRGVHVDPDDVGQHAFLEEARPHLEAFYDRYGCELRQTPEHVYYLRPRGDQLGRRHLGRSDMLVGQALALLRLDPETTTTAGRVPTARILEVLSQLLGEEGAGEALTQSTRRKRRTSETSAQKRIRTELSKALRNLARLGFCEVHGDQVRLKSAVLRFADPVRAAGDREAALARLIQTGEVVLGAPPARDEGTPSAHDAAEGEEVGRDDA